MGKKKKQIKQPDVQVPEGNIQQGKSIFEELCSTCHALGGDSKSAAAPSLAGIIGRNSGTTNFPYSKAMKGSNFVWSEKHLFVYLINPGKYIPGNKMAFSGLPDTTDRANLIAYLADN